MTFSSNFGMRNQLESINERLVLLEELGVSNGDLLILLHLGLRVKYHQVIFNLLKITLPLLERQWFFIPFEWVLGELVSLQGRVVSLDNVSFNFVMELMMKMMMLHKAISAPSSSTQTLTVFKSCLSFSFFFLSLESKSF